MPFSTTQVCWSRNTTSGSHTNCRGLHPATNCPSSQSGGRAQSSPRSDPDLALLSFAPWNARPYECHAVEIAGSTSERQRHLAASRFALLGAWWRFEHTVPGGSAPVTPSCILTGWARYSQLRDSWIMGLSGHRRGSSRESEQLSGRARAGLDLAAAPSYSVAA